MQDKYHSMYILIVVIFTFSCSAVPLTVYDNARFQPNLPSLFFKNLSNILSRDQCACQCYSDQWCLTATYSGIDQQCSLCFASPDQGRMYLVLTTEQASVLYFTKKTLPQLSLLTTTNETVYGIWNTTASGNSSESSVGYETGCYYYNEQPWKAFDQSNMTASKYTNFGACGSNTYGYQCGLDTGLYLTPERGSSLLIGIRFCTGNDNPNRDPFTVTIEGSNQLSDELIYGSSWSLIYNGSTGLQNVTTRNQFGPIQYISNNSIWYTSYRILVTSKRDTDSSAQYSEIELLGYQLPFFDQ